MWWQFVLTKIALQALMTERGLRLLTVGIGGRATIGASMNNIENNNRYKELLSLIEDLTDLVTSPYAKYDPRWLTLLRILREIIKSYKD